jgi:hypothetical protein
VSLCGPLLVRGHSLSTIALSFVVSRLNEFRRYFARGGEL